MSQVTKYHSPVKRWSSPAPLAAILQGKQLLGIVLESNPNLIIRAFIFPGQFIDSTFFLIAHICDMNREPAAHNPFPAGFSEASLRRRSAAAPQPYTGQ